MWENILPLFRNIAIFPFLASFFVAVISVPAVIQIANYFHLIDDPDKRPHAAHTEKRILPRAGGIATYFGIVIAAAIFLPMAKGLVGILLGGGVLLVVGLIDDYKDVPPWIRLLVNFLAAGLAVAGGAGISFITNPLTGGVIHFDTVRWSFDFLGQHSILPIADLLAVLWIAWCMNMVGFSGGVDGQLPGFVTIAAFTIGLLSFSQINIENFTGWTGTTLAFITAGAYLGFLPWNFFPQKILPGYSAKSLAGYMLATLSILSAAKFGTLLLVLGIPAIDAIYVKLGQLMSGKSPTSTTRTFLHHRLLDFGWSKPKIALFYWGVSAILAMVALSVNAKQKFFAILLVAVSLGALILWLKLSSIFSKKSDQGNG